MKVTHHWLREFTPLDVPPGELAERLTLEGLEVEALTPVAPPFSGVLVGQVLSVKRHPNAEKLAVCEVTTDGSDRLQIICGAPNVRDDLKVAVAMIGARLPDGLTIKRAKLRGLESDGMLCSARELGLGQEHDGIMELPSTLALHLDVRTALDLDDTTLEVNATPNRGDCMSVFGIARDYAAAYHGHHLEYRGAPVVAQHAEVFPVSIAVPAACRVFGSRIIRGVRAPSESPAWLRERLRRVGLHSVSPIVDITNYVMMELGQPLHAYDLMQLSGGITVRQALAGERLALLNDQEHLLEPDYLVIADARGAVGLAGIMGGRESAISDATTDVLLEAAHFAPAAIAGQARRAGLFTDAAQRFERGVDPTLPAVALERATALLLQIAGGHPGPVQLTDAEPRDRDVPDEAAWIDLRRSRLARLLGVSVPDAAVASLLAAVTGHVEGTADGWRVRRPPHRFDLRIEADLIEEVARLRGFDSIAESHAAAPQVAGVATESRVGKERLLTAMADAGYREVITYSFVDPVLQRQLFPAEPALALANPISADLSEMRVSLWPGLIQAALENLRRQQTRVRLFEIGTKFMLRSAPSGEHAGALGAPSGEQGGAQSGLLGEHASAQGAPSPEQGGPSRGQAGTQGAPSREQGGAQSGLSRGQGAPSGEQGGTQAAPSPERAGSQTAVLHEIETLAGIATGARWPEQWGSGPEPLDFYDVKHDLLQLFALTGAGAEFRFEQALLGCLRPGRTARIYRGAVPVGWLGEAHPALVKTLALPADALLFEVEIESAFVAKPATFKVISRFPSIRRDLAIVVDESVPLAVLQENVTVSASGLLSELRVFDVYRGPGVDSGRKSIALGLILQDSSRTLTDVDADAVLTAVITRLRDQLSASIRDR